MNQTFPERKNQLAQKIEDPEEHTDVFKKKKGSKKILLYQQSKQSIFFFLFFPF